MARKGGAGVDVYVESLLDADTPHCPHGPTLLFERVSYKVSGTVERFYACSACRDRRDCPFFQHQGTKVSESAQKARKLCLKEMQPPFTHKQHCKRLQAFRQLSLKDRQFCSTCGQLLLSAPEIQSHSGHETIKGLKKVQLLRPTSLLCPLDNKKTNAQYLFSEEAVQFFISVIKDLNVKKVLCIGAPRIHESLYQRNKINSEDKIDSYLLDIDYRLEQFYPPKRFSRYNMFNHHFFGGSTSKQHYLSFLQGQDKADSKLLIVTDPPFGGLVDVLAFNLKRVIQDYVTLQDQRSCEPYVMWFFPYFLEQRILSCLPNFTMLDYKVNYENHEVFQGKESGGSKHGSPVRIFTNLQPDRVCLPKEEGYRFCETCQRYVAKENKHCEICNSCTSKDGRTYIHCVKCQRCVKPSRVHCDTCNVCDLPGHKCDQPKPQGCHICGDLSHKRRECPQRLDPYRKNERLKRKHNSNPVRASKKQKRSDNCLSVMSDKHQSEKRNKHLKHQKQKHKKQRKKIK